MYFPSSNPSSSQASLTTAPVLPYENCLQHRTAKEDDAVASKDAVAAHRRALEAAMAHKANSSDRFLLSAQERDAMLRAEAVRGELRAASAKRVANAVAVTEAAARERACNADTHNNNGGCASIWDFGCRTDIFQAACDGDVDMLHANLQAAAAEVDAAVAAVLLAHGGADGQVSEVASGRSSCSATEGSEEAAEGVKVRAAERARAAAVASSPRVALAVNLINAVGQPRPTTYGGVQFEKRWTFQAPPLALAAAFNRERAVKALLAWGADPMQTSSTGLTALDYAKQRGYGEIVDQLTAAIQTRQQSSGDANTSDLTTDSA